MDIDTTNEQDNIKPISKNTELMMQFGMGFSSTLIIYLITLTYQRYQEFYEENMVYIIFMFALGIFNFIIPKKRGFYDKYQKSLLYEKKTLTQKIIRMSQDETSNRAGKASGDLSIYLVSLLPTIIPNLTITSLASYIITIITFLEANILIVLPFFIAFITSIVSLINLILYQISKIL